MASSNAARVKGSLSSHVCGAAKRVPCPSISASTRANSSGALASRYSVQPSARAVVSWPAPMKVMMLSSISARDRPSGPSVFSSSVRKSCGAAFPGLLAINARRCVHGAGDDVAEEGQRAAAADLREARHPIRCAKKVKRVNPAHGFKQALDFMGKTAGISGNLVCETAWPTRWRRSAASCPSTHRSSALRGRHIHRQNGR